MRVKHIFEMVTFLETVISNGNLYLFSILPNCQIKIKKWVKTIQTIEKILVPMIYNFKVRKGLIYGRIFIKMLMLRFEE